LTDTETEEIRKIKHRLDSDEKVEIVAKQSRIHPGGSATSPDIIQGVLSDSEFQKLKQKLL